MCLYTTKETQITKTEEDIIVYKILILQDNNSLKSPFWNFIYKLNKTYQSPITEDKTSSIGTSNNKAFTQVYKICEETAKDLGYKNFANYYSYNWNNPNYETIYKRLKSITKGIHSYVSYKTVLNSYDQFKEHEERLGKAVIVKCIIPKGSSYIKGFGDEIVSNHIIIKEELVV